MSMRMFMLRLARPISRLLDATHIRLGKPRLTGDMYREVMSKIRPGDIILTRTALRPVNLFIPGHWSHALMVGFGEDGTLVEATPPKVRLSTLVDVWAGCTQVMVVRPRSADRMVQARAYGEAIEYMGRPYDTSFRLGDDAFYCTELIVRAYHAAGHDLPAGTIGIGKLRVIPPDAFTGAEFKTLFDSRLIDER